MAVVYIAGCSPRPEDSAPGLREESLGGVEVVACELPTGKRVHASIQLAGYDGRLHTNTAGWGRFVLPAGRQVLTYTYDNNAVVETTINVIPDTLLPLRFVVPLPDGESRRIPPESCAVITGTVTAGSTRQGLSGASVRARGFMRGAIVNSGGNYRLCVPAGRLHLEAGAYQRTSCEIETCLAAGETATINFRMHLELESDILRFLLRHRAAPYVPQPVLDATAADSVVVRAVEDWLELSEREHEDTMAARWFAAFDLFGTHPQGRWLVAYGRQLSAEFSVVGELPERPILATQPSVVYLLHTHEGWVAVGTCYSRAGRLGWSTFEDAESRYPLKYRRRVRSQDGREQLEARLKAKAIAWRKRVREFKSHNP